MSALAEILINRGCIVSGSDINYSDTVKHLESLGLKFCLGHKGENVTGADAVVYTAAVKPDNQGRRAFP